jgi:hypothetical protein
LLRPGNGNQERAIASPTDRRSAERRKSDRRSDRALADGGAELIGYRIEAPDGAVGRAADFCIEQEGWAVTGLLAAPRRLFPTRRRIFVPLSAIERIDRRAKTIYVRVSREELARGSRRQPRA